MTTIINQTARWMDERGRTFRVTPVDTLPTAERFSQVERLIDAVWSVGRSLGFDLSRQPTIIYTGQGALQPPELLRHLTELENEVLCTLLMTGLGSAARRALYEHQKTPMSKPAPNYHVIVDETFDDETLPENAFTD